MFSMWTMWLKKYSLLNLRALCASTSGRQVCGGKNTSTRFGEPLIPDWDQCDQNSNIK